ncbi:unnamed protein product [Cuscuta europaea]|uniref:Uncharacterized protein n=1 Tax=Cuscuta europaea TaxID=41803 RepID=A0A9P1EF76_CUSEU|nr:unnamed protein product [Cuscuta europaea]
MNADALFSMKKKKSQAQPKKKPSGQKPVEAFFQKDVEPSAASAAAAAEGVREPPTDVATKKKKAGKGESPPTKKQKNVGDVAEKAAPIVIIEEQSSSESPVAGVLTAPSDLPRESLQIPLIKGTAVMHNTIEPRAFLGSITSPLDRRALETYDDEALENKILRSSLTACIALGEQARRLEAWRLHKAEQEETRKKLIHDKDASLRETCMLEEALRQMELKLEAVRMEARAEGKAEAEMAAAKDAKKADVEAEKAKLEAVAAVERAAVDAFVAEGWEAAEREEWVSSVV